jgi:cell wall assembly regulator SMI1
MEIAIEFIELIRSVIPDYQNQLNRGCTIDEIADLENKLQKTLPESYKELLKFCNGEKETTLLLGYFMLPIDRVFGEFSFIKSGEDFHTDTQVTQANMVQPSLYSKDRVPFADDASGNFLCIDYDPAEGGKVGQIIYLPFGEPDPITAVANNFDEFLKLLINGIKNGTVTIEESAHSDTFHLNINWIWYYGWSTTEAKLIDKII